MLHSVAYPRAPQVDLSWLTDPDDWPVMQTALAARADVQVTDNTRDSPNGQTRHGVLLLSSPAFLTSIYQQLSTPKLRSRDVSPSRRNPPAAATQTQRPAPCVPSASRMTL